ncbi:hypothetical protein ABPG72_003870 [Tetrahymena utriculariae]
MENIYLIAKIIHREIPRKNNKQQRKYAFVSLEQNGMQYATMKSQFKDTAIDIIQTASECQLNQIKYVGMINDSNRSQINEEGQGEKQVALIIKQYPYIQDTQAVYEEHLSHCEGQGWNISQKFINPEDKQGNISLNLIN